MDGCLHNKQPSITAGFYDILIMTMMIPVLFYKWKAGSVLRPLMGDTTDRGYCCSFCLHCVYCVKTLKSVSWTDRCDVPLQQALCKLAVIRGGEAGVNAVIWAKFWTLYMYMKIERLMLMLTESCSFLDKPPCNNIFEDFLGWNCPLQVHLHIGHTF